MVTGDVTIAGLLDLVFMDGFRPRWRDEFRVVSAEHVDGMFANAGETIEFDGITFDVEYAANAVTLTSGEGSDPLLVGFNVRPGGDENPINLHGKGVVKMGLLADEQFDIAEVDLESLMFGDPELLGEVLGVGPEKIKIQDINGDGLDDLALVFRTDDLVDGGALGPESAMGILVGQLLDGTPLEGFDSLRIVPSFHNNSPYTVTQIPEPSTASLAILLLAVSTLIRLRRHE